MNRSVADPHAAWLACLLAGVLLSAGCQPSEPPRFRLNLMEMARNEIPEPRQKEIATVLEALFGTPDEPFVVEETGLDQRRLETAAGSVWSDQGGRKFGLYREHCAHCHGITGDGYGPTATFLNPYPRDYTAGKFKFKSTDRSRQPTHGDLMRILEQGIPGTAMPSFRLLPSEEREALVEYVKYLGIRGQTEAALVAWCAFELDEEEPIETDRGLLIDELLMPIVDAWSEADQYVIHPDQQAAPTDHRSAADLAASVAAGRELFHGKTANCFTCHGETALGDGQTTEYDDWNKAVKDFEESYEGIDLASFGRLAPRTAQPRNLRRGVYRGGRRPVDLFWRIYSGINGTPMPAVGPASPGAKGVLSSEEIWNLVDYVQQLPFEPASMPPRLHQAPLRERL